MTSGRTAGRSHAGRPDAGMYQGSVAISSPPVQPRPGNRHDACLDGEVIVRHVSGRYDVVRGEPTPLVVVDVRPGEQSSLDPNRSQGGRHDRYQDDPAMAPRHRDGTCGRPRAAGSADARGGIRTARCGRGSAGRRASSRHGLHHRGPARGHSGRALERVADGAGAAKLIDLPLRPARMVGSPDQRKIAILPAPGRARIYVYDIARARLSALSFAPTGVQRIHGLTWLSPTRILVSATKSTRTTTYPLTSRLYSMTTTGGKPIAFRNLRGTEPSAAPGAARLLYVRFRDAGPNAADLRSRLVVEDLMSLELARAASHASSSTRATRTPSTSAVFATRTSPPTASTS